ncbi:hypothetical protein CJ030_MR6G013303 [Morella rubra]|uniref:Protein RALF-like 33 n=1 Tax=Morella rubra TaxID=262757 RepID=A0A6A1VFQ8_9ROSI|nr:hypothetical protein CJ030_MR6G013303 [Morella rubra]
MAEETAKRGPFVALLLTLMILVLTTHCGASASIQLNGTSLNYHGRMEEPEPMFASEISRMLLAAGSIVYGAGNKDAVIKCGHKGYRSCLPDSTGHPLADCGTYKRDCPH